MYCNIKGLGYPLDGVLVKLNEEDLDICSGLIKDKMLYAVSLVCLEDAGEFCVFGENLEDAELEKDKRAVNPNGEYRGEVRIKRHSLEAVLVEYANFLTVTVLEHEHEDGKYNDTRGREIVHTRYTQNYRKNITAVKEAVEKAVMLGDLDDLIFDLKNLVEK